MVVVVIVGALVLLVAVLAWKRCYGDVEGGLEGISEGIPQNYNKYRDRRLSAEDRRAEDRREKPEARLKEVRDEAPEP